MSPLHQRRWSWRRPSADTGARTTRKGPRRPPRYALAYLRTFLPVLLVFLSFVLGLTAYALLGRMNSPAEKDRLGAQAWEEIELASDVEAEAIDSAAGHLRLDKWDPMAEHTTGLTEIAIRSCLISPTFIRSRCRPPSTQQEDKEKGKWVLVAPNLNPGLSYINLWYRRTRDPTVAVITDVKVVSSSESSQDLAGWTQADGNLQFSPFGGGNSPKLWYKLGPAGNASTVITEMSVLYGGNDPFFGFERVRGGQVAGKAEAKSDAVELVLRRGNPKPPRAKRLKFHSNGTFKIMQIADLHYSVGQGKCRDTPGECEGDIDTETWLADALDAEKPDLVVFSGDQLNGQGTSFDSVSVLAKFAKPVIARQLPWAAVFGNHDSEIEDDRAEQMRAMMRMPYSLARAGPKHVAGVGNYDLRVYSSDPSRMHLLTLYFIDSHAAIKTWSPLSYIFSEYDYIKPSQIEWYRNVSASVKPIQRPFHPDGGKDLGHIWARGPQRQRQDNDDATASQATLGKPNALMFFHIPLPEAYDKADLVDGNALDLGSQEGSQGTSKTNSGLFSTGIKHSYELPADETATHITEVKVLAHGHCHLTDRCRRVGGVWMCFAGGSSYSGYGSPNFDRRVRVFNVSDYGEAIASYKRLVSGKIVDHQLLVGPGAPAGWGH